MKLPAFLNSTKKVEADLKKRAQGLIQELDQADLPLKVQPSTFAATKRKLGALTLTAKCFSANGRDLHEFHLTLGFRDTGALKDFSVLDVHCSCKDYAFRYQAANFKAGLDSEEPAQYEKKTTRAPVNPDGHVGCCKHVASLVLVAQRKGYLPSSSK